MESRISNQIADAAGVWDARLRAPDCADDDRARFAAWRDANPEHRRAFEEIQAIVTIFRSNMGRADIRALRDAALRAPRQPWWGRLARGEDYTRSRKITVAVAASVAILAIGVTIWTTLPDTVRRAPLRELAAVAARISDYALAQSTTYQTGIGQRSTITLQDGSTVDLNAKTRIRVSFNAERRSVELLGGQALFHVARNPQRPFVVRAGNRDIVAVGTAFDVRLDATTVRVTLIEGKVNVRQSSSDAKDGAPSAMRPEALSLTPGQQLIAELDSSRRVGGDGHRMLIAAGGQGAAAEPGVFVRATDVTKVTGWRDGRVFLEDLTLADAVAEMNKYSQTQIRLDDAALANLRVNGMFRAGEQQAFVTALQDYFPITVHRDGDAEIVLAPER